MENNSTPSEINDQTLACKEVSAKYVKKCTIRVSQVRLNPSGAVAQA